MFLSSLHSTSSFGREVFGDTSALRASIEADLAHLPGFSGRDLSVYAAGSSIILEGTVESDLDFTRALNLAQDIAGEDKVICRVRVVSPSMRR